MTNIVWASTEEIVGPNYFSSPWLRVSVVDPRRSQISLLTATLASLLITFDLL
jgi:hypothetical protein